MEEKNENTVGFLVYTSMPILLLIVIMVRRFQLPEYGEDILQTKCIFSALQIVAGGALILIGIFISKGEEEIRGGFVKVFLSFLGIVICGYTVYESYWFVKDLDETTQFIFLETSSCNRKGHKYYLEGEYEGTQYSFDITGVDKYMVARLNDDILGVGVYAYPNSNLVYSFEFYKDMKNYGENLPFGKIIDCNITLEEVDPDKDVIFVLAEDKEQDVALYGLQKNDQYGALVRVGNTVWYSSLFWNDYDDGYPPQICFKNIDNDDDKELLIQHFDKAEYDVPGKNVFTKRGTLYIYDYNNGEWMMNSLNPDDCYDVLGERFSLTTYFDGYQILKLDGVEIARRDIPKETAEHAAYEGYLYITGVIRYDLEKMTVIIKPFYYYQEATEFDEIEFPLTYQEGKIGIGNDYTILTQ